ncbi:DUF6402 family protein [Pseudomonas viridiflava]|uniref:DUF6402 family protein n=1 Tax=Pseudomonas viridiflava TaxID=33069 RepID=UPI000F05ACDA|nr:DUF6402 family protein [Pseudomonas viridiflava]
MSLNDFKRTNALGPETYYALPQGASHTYAPTDTPAKEVIIQSLALSRIPEAMRNMGWHTAAALMQRWFDSPAWEMPGEWKGDKTKPAPLSLNPAHSDDSIVKMDWAMKFERCRDAVEAAKLLVASPNGVKQLEDRLKKAGWDGKSFFELGSTSMSSIQVDASTQINFTKFGEAWDVLDDMYGALGLATLKVGVTGNTFIENSPITLQPHRYFHVQHMGFYIRDNYDFNGFQYLGTWTENRVLTKIETVMTTTPQGHLVIRLRNGPFAVVTNGDFRDYRKEIGKGGDFIIYSDVLWEKTDQIIDLGLLS